MSTKKKSLPVKLFPRTSPEELTRKMREELGLRAGPYLEDIERWLKRDGKEVMDFPVGC